MKQSASEEELFAAALALPASERSLYLRRACGGDQDLCERLTKLLEAFGDAFSFVNEQAKVAQADADRVGPYRLLQELGEGGCGVAYLAEQTAPVKRHVALKVIKPGMDTKAVIARFEAERQVLALLDHPNIAKVFDAGTTREGRPYFVMELIRGIKMTDYCDHSRLTVLERLALFIQVCHAIHHAHQHGIIHRDIKPSNVLVTQHDGMPLAKVIDFGLAKAICSAPVGSSQRTALGEFMGTPAYVSPEQTDSGLPIDARSDVYSLGVLLHELLTGCTPFETSDLMKSGLESMRQRIREEEPLRPSRRVMSMPDEQAAQVCTHRQLERSTLIPVLQRDLDWIVMRCLEKESTRRYQSAEELAQDIQRHLRHEPVFARPPALSYSLGKVVQRYRTPFIATSCALACLAAAGIIAAYTSQRATRAVSHATQQGERAEQLSKAMLELVSVADPYQSFSRKITAESLLDQAKRSIESSSSLSLATRADLFETIGIAQRRQGRLTEALEYLQEAVRLRRQTQDYAQTTNALSELAATTQINGDAQGAETLLAEGFAIVEQRGLERSRSHAKLLQHLGNVRLITGGVEEALGYIEQSLRLMQIASGRRTEDTADALLAFATAQQWTDDFVAAEHAAREAVSIYREILPPYHPNRTSAEALLAETLYHQGRLEEASSLLLECLQKQTQIFGGMNARELVDILHSLADIRYLQGRLVEAEQFGRQAVNASTASWGAVHPAVAVKRTLLANILTARGNYAEAETQTRQALAILAAKTPTDHPYVASAEYYLGEILLATGRPSEAERILTTSLNRSKRNGAPSWRAARSASALGEALYRQGHTEDGKKYLLESFHQLANDPKADPEATLKAGTRIERYFGTVDVMQEREEDPTQMAPGNSI